MLLLQAIKMSKVNCALLEICCGRELIHFDLAQPFTKSKQHENRGDYERFQVEAITYVTPLFDNDNDLKHIRQHPAWRKEFKLFWQISLDLIKLITKESIVTEVE